MSRFSGSNMLNQQEPQRVYEQEVQLNALFDELSEGFKKLDELNDNKKNAELKRMTGIMSECKALIRSFENEAKIDNVPVDEINYRKKLLVQELNSFIGLKKAYASQLQQRKELLAGNSTPLSIQSSGPTVEDVRDLLVHQCSRGSHGLVLLVGVPCTTSCPLLRHVILSHDPIVHTISIGETNAHGRARGAWSGQYPGDGRVSHEIREARE